MSFQSTKFPTEKIFGLLNVQENAGNVIPILEQEGQ
jgi:hypothetical protein